MNQKEESGCFGCAYILVAFIIIIIAFGMYHDKGTAIDPPLINNSK